MEETNNLDGTEEVRATEPSSAEATAEEIRKAKDLLRANGYALFGYREVGAKIKRVTISGLCFVKRKWKDLGGWLSAKRDELKARQEERRLAAAEKGRLAEEAEARRTEAESARVGTVAESRSAGSNAVPRCAACGAELVLGARFCRKCGKSVSAVRDTPTAEPPAEAKSVSATVEDPSESTGKKCAACGAALMVGMKFCGECGTPVNAKTRNPRQRKTDSPRKNTRPVEE